MKERALHKKTYWDARAERNFNKANCLPTSVISHPNSPDMFFKTGMNLNDEKRMPRIRKPECNHPARKQKKSRLLCLKTSSIYALNRIGNAETVARKIFWIIIFVTGTALCVLQVWRFLTSYFDYPVVVDIETRYNESLEFPGVTICNMNDIRNEFMSCIIDKKGYKDCLHLNQSGESGNTVSNDTEPECVLGNDTNSFLSAILKLNGLMGFYSEIDFDSRKWYGHQASDFIKMCSINKQPCSYANFESSLSNHYGNCFTFKPGKEHVHSAFPGPQGGLELEIDLEISKYYTMFTSSAGVRIQIHDPYTPHNVDEKGIALGPGTKNYIAVTKSVFSRLPPPYKDRCKDYGTGGSRHGCIEKCLHEITTKECFCTTTKNPHDGVRQCGGSSIPVVCCLIKYLDRSFCDCPLDCEDTVYNLQVSSAAVFTETQINAMTSRLGFLNARCQENQHSCLVVKVYYDTFEYTVFQQHPKYTGEQILSQIGGLMGLWLGVSLIAIFELLESVLLWGIRQLKSK